MIRENVYDNFDEFYRDLVNYIASDKGTDIKENVRTVYADGTPAYYRQVIGLQVRFKPYKDSKGNYRALLPTTRYAPYKSAIKELQFIWKDKSNDVRYLREDLGCSYWNEWVDYSINNKELIEVEIPKIKDKVDYNSLNLYVDTGNEYIDINKKIRITKDNDKYYVLKHFRDENNQRKILIQFLESKNIKVVSQGNLREVSYIRDEFKRTVCGIGYHGNCKSDDIQKYFGKYYLRWRTIWKNIIHRCVGMVNEENKHLYENCTVGASFHSLENFLRWVMKNNKYGEWGLRNLDVDKDYFGTKHYSENTCVLLNKLQNSILDNLWYKFNNIYFFSKKDLSLYMNLSMYSLNKLLNEDNNDIEIIDPKKLNINGKLFRFKSLLDETIKKGYGYQLAKPLYNYSSQVDYIIGEIKNNSNSRRIITELWNVDDLEDMTLTPCLHHTQWIVENGKLTLFLKQRSVDTALGLISNLFQYQILQHLIAKECNLEVGDLIWTGVNIHIYDRHIDKLGEQVMRKFYNPPTFKINNFNGFYNFKWNDVELLDYEYGDKIKYEVAI